MDCKWWIITLLILLPSLMKWNFKLPLKTCSELKGLYSMIHFFLFIPPAEVYCFFFLPFLTNNLFFVFYLTFLLYYINVFISGKCQIQKYKVYIVLKKQDVLCEQNQTGFPLLMLAIKQNSLPQFFLSSSLPWKGQINAAVCCLSRSGFTSIQLSKNHGLRWLNTAEILTFLREAAGISWSL